MGDLSLHISLQLHPHLTCVLMLEVHILMGRRQRRDGEEVEKGSEEVERGWGGGREGMGRR